MKNDKPTKCSCSTIACYDLETEEWEHEIVECDWCKGLEERLAIADAFCEVAAKMDSFDYHPLMIAWKELQTPNERNEQ